MMMILHDFQIVNKLTMTEWIAVCEEEGSEPIEIETEEG
jgi:hypothetical protein